MLSAITIVIDIERGILRSYSCGTRFNNITRIVIFIGIGHGYVVVVFVVVGDDCVVQATLGTR